MKKKLLAILTGAAITATCFSALAACNDGKSDNNNSGNSNTEQSGNNSGNSNAEQSGNSNSGNSNTEQNGGIEKISEQQFKNALAVFSSGDYWQSESEYQIVIPEGYKDYFYTNTIKERYVFDGNNKIVYSETTFPKGTYSGGIQEMYYVAEEQNLSLYVSIGINQSTIMQKLNSKNFVSAADTEKVLRSMGEPTLGAIYLPCKTEESGEDKFLSDLYDKLKFDETENSYSVNVLYKLSDIIKYSSMNYLMSLVSMTHPEEGTLEVSFKFIFENGKIKTLTCDYAPNLSEILEVSLAGGYSGGYSYDVKFITYNFSYDEIPVTLPEEAKSATKV